MVPFTRGARSASPGLRAVGDVPVQSRCLLASHAGSFIPPQRGPRKAAQVGACNPERLMSERVNARHTTNRLMKWQLSTTVEVSPEGMTPQFSRGDFGAGDSRAYVQQLPSLGRDDERAGQPAHRHFLWPRSTWAGPCVASAGPSSSETQ